MTGQKKTENILYAVLWAVFFSAPLLSEYLEAGTSTDGYYDWHAASLACQVLAAFCVTFFLHNFFVAPMLVYRNRKWGYFGALAALLVCFQLYRCHAEEHTPHPPYERHAATAQPLPEPADGSRCSSAPPPPREPHKAEAKRPPRRAAISIGEKDMAIFWLMLLLLGANVAIKFFFKTIDDRKRMRALEQDNLRQQLAHLKYQINPHFFMNTLNNIHALVRINPEQAEETIEMLSKLMRYVLYEGDKPLAPLERELAFTQNYVDLMRIRYASNVDIRVTFPDRLPPRMVPPLIFLTFVENAFKHGISYERPSFVHVELTAESGRVTFTCRNSRKPAGTDVHGGVGLANVRQRLDLIFHKRYSLDISADADSFYVKLILPLTDPKPQSL